MVSGYVPSQEKVPLAISVMGREISRPDFPAGTRRESLSRPVSSRHFETSLGLVLSRIQFPENFKVLSCLEYLLTGCVHTTQKLSEMAKS